MHTPVDPVLFSQPQRGCRASRPERVTDLPRVTQPASSRGSMLPWSPAAPAPGSPGLSPQRPRELSAGTEMVIWGLHPLSSAAGAPEPLSVADRK